MTSKAKAQLRAARQALEANSQREETAGITRETREFGRLNRAVLDASGKVPCWRDERSEVRDLFRFRREDRDDRRG